MYTTIHNNFVISDGPYSNITKENETKCFILTPAMTCSFEIVSAFSTTYSTQILVLHMGNCFHHQEKSNIRAGV